MLGKWFLTPEQDRRMKTFLAKIRDKDQEAGAGGFSSRGRLHPPTCLQVGHFLHWESCRQQR